MRDVELLGEVAGRNASRNVVVAPFVGRRDRLLLLLGEAEPTLLSVVHVVDAPDAEREVVLLAEVVGSRKRVPVGKQGAQEPALTVALGDEDRPLLEEDVDEISIDSTRCIRISVRVFPVAVTDSYPSFPGTSL